MNLHRYYGLSMVLLATVLLNGCGIKPSSLEPPGDVPKDEFPHDYPVPDDSQTRTYPKS